MVISQKTYTDLGFTKRASPGRGDPMPVLHRKVLAHLAIKATNANGYTAIQLAGHDVEETDDAIGALHHAGLLNAFFIARSASPRFHPSSLTGEGRRTFDRQRRESRS